MTLFNILDVALALATVFVGLSCVCSAIQEQLAAILHYRGTTLYTGIRNLVFDQDIADQIMAHPAVDVSINDKVGLRSVRTQANRPSYMNGKTFALAFWDVIIGSPSDVSARAQAMAQAAASVAASLPNDADAQARSAAATERASLQLGIANAQSALEVAMAAQPYVAADVLAKRANLSSYVVLRDSSAPFVDAKEAAESLPDDNLRKIVTAMVGRSVDMNSLLEVTAHWFDIQMERVSGWYRRSVQIQLVLIASIVTLLIGLDSVELAVGIYTTPALLTAAAGSVAGAFPATGSATPADQANVARAAQGLFTPSGLNGLLHPFIGIGLLFAETPSSAQIASDQATLAQAKAQEDAASALIATDKNKLSSLAFTGAARTSLVQDEANAEVVAASAASSVVAAQKVIDRDDAAARKNESFLSHIPGYLITIAALSLGGPFWFDVLGRIMSVRAAGTKPPSSAAEQSTS